MGLATAFRSSVPGERWCRHHRPERRARHGNRSDTVGQLGPFEGNGVSTIVLDLHDLTFIDSTGLHAFLEARNRAMSNGQRLLVRGASPTAQRHVEIVGLQVLLDDPEHESELLV
jgi:MFS superfamily sulfate permease-like transporter